MRPTPRISLTMAKVGHRTSPQTGFHSADTALAVTSNPARYSSRRENPYWSRDYGHSVRRPCGTTIYDLGAQVSLKSVLGKQDTLVVFVRHYGCIFCRSRLAGLGEHMEAKRRHRVLVIGNGGSDGGGFRRRDRP